MELTRGRCPASIVTQKNARLDMGFSDMHDSIARLATWCHFDAGHILYLEGEPAEALYILERGWVRATRMSLDGVEARVANMLLKHAEASDGRLVVRRQAWTTFDEMAPRLGTVRDVLSRVLKTLKEEGVLCNNAAFLT